MNSFSAPEAEQEDSSTAQLFSQQETFLWEGYGSNSIANSV